MDPELDAIVQELGEVVDRLNATPADAFAERFSLQKRQDELRAAAARFHQDRDAATPTAVLLAELSALRSQLRAIRDQRIDMVTQAGGGTAAGSGADGMGGVVLNQGMEAAQGADRMRARIGAIEAVLAARGVDTGVA